MLLWQPWFMSFKLTEQYHFQLVPGSIRIRSQGHQLSRAHDLSGKSGETGSSTGNRDEIAMPRKPPILSHIGDISTSMCSCNRRCTCHFLQSMPTWCVLIVLLVLMLKHTGGMYPWQRTSLHIAHSGVVLSFGVMPGWCCFLRVTPHSGCSVLEAHEWAQYPCRHRHRHTWQADSGVRADQTRSRQQLRAPASAPP